MAFQMNFTDVYGNINAASYWTIVQLNMNVPERTTLLLFYGYKDKVAWQEGAQNIGAKAYNITGSTFDYYLQLLTTPNPATPTLDKVCEAYATSTKDVATSDPAVFVSFFENATGV